MDFNTYIVELEKLEEAATTIESDPVHGVHLLMRDDCIIASSKSIKELKNISTARNSFPSLLKIVRELHGGLDKINCDGMCEVRGYGNLECGNCGTRRTTLEKVNAILEGERK